MIHSLIYSRISFFLSCSIVLLIANQSYGNTISPSEDNYSRNLPIFPNQDGLPNNTITVPNVTPIPSTQPPQPTNTNSDNSTEDNIPLSQGDIIRVFIENGDIFSGVYTINLGGDIQIPYLTPIYVAGLTLQEAQNLIREELIKQKMFKPDFAKVTVGIMQWSAIEVNVSGAVFQPGPVTINVRKTEDQSFLRNNISGDYAPNRSVTDALRAAGGITPMANIEQVTIIRNNQPRVVDISGIFDGIPVENPPLIRGDRIIVPQSETWRNELVRPSAITLPAVFIRISNLTVPANSNSSSSLDTETITFPYGSRLSQAVIFGNCAGGTQVTNAQRFAVLVRTDRLTGTTKFYESSIENLIRNGNNENNPYLMPDDGVACYDSVVTNVRDGAKTIFDILSPITLIKSIFGW